jgi:hypothetical protein
MTGTDKIPKDPRSGDDRRAPIVEHDEHPAHYGGGENVHEVWNCLDAWGLIDDAHLWQAAKYVARTGKKDDDLVELRKARQYLNRAIKRRERERAIHFANPRAEPAVTACRIPQKDARFKTEAHESVSCEDCQKEIRGTEIPRPRSVLGENPFQGLHHELAILWAHVNGEHEAPHPECTHMRCHAAMGSNPKRSG